MPGKPSRLILFLVFLLVCMIWGSSWAVTRIGLFDLRPVIAAGLRFAIATIALTLYMLLRKEKLPRDRVYWRLTAYLTFAAVTIPFALIYWGQMRVPSGVSSVLFGTFPFWVGLLAHFFLPGQRIRIAKAIGIIVGFVGILVVSGSEIRIEGWDVGLGVAAIVVGAFLQASALVAIIRFGVPYSPASLNIVPMAAGSIILLSVSALLGDFGSLLLTPSAIATLLYLALFSTVLTFLLYYWLAKHVQAVFLSFSAFLTPIVGVFIGWLAMNETVSPEVLIGSAVVIVGIAIADVADVRNHPSAPH